MRSEGRSARCCGMPWGKVVVQRLSGDVFPMGTLAVNMSGLLRDRLADRARRAPDGRHDRAAVRNDRDLRRLHDVFVVQPADPESGAGRRMAAASANIVASVVLCLVVCGSGMSPLPHTDKGCCDADPKQTTCCASLSERPTGTGPAALRGDRSEGARNASGGRDRAARADGLRPSSHCTRRRSCGCRKTCRS